MEKWHPAHEDPRGIKFLRAEALNGLTLSKIAPESPHKGIKTDGNRTKARKADDTCSVSFRETMPNRKMREDQGQNSKIKVQSSATR
jgi:hypothetical protein